MSNPQYNIRGKFISSVGENNTIIQVFNTGANIIKNIAKGIYHRITGEQDDIRLMRERNSYLKKEVEINQRRLFLEFEQHKLEQEKFAHKVAFDINQAAQEGRMVELKARETSLREQENRLYEEEIACKRDFYSKLIEAVNNYQKALVQIKSLEIQANWDLHNLPFYFSREETQRIFQHNSGLLVLLAPTASPNDIQGLGNYLEKELEDALQDITSRYYSADQNFHSVEFCKIFKRPIADIESAYVRELIVRPTLILSSTMTDQKVHITVTCPVDIEQQSTNIQRNQEHISWDWEELAEQLEANGKTRLEVLRIIREMISIMHILIASYFADLYYLSFDPFYIPKLPKIVKELPSNLLAGLEPFQSSLDQITVSRKIDALQYFANEMSTEGDFLRASQAYRELIKINPTNTRLHYDLGNSLYCLANNNESNLPVPISFYREAAKSFLQAFKSENYGVNRSNYIYAYRYASISIILSHIDNEDIKKRHQNVALHLYDKIVEISHEDEFIKTFMRNNSVHINLGRILLDRGNYQSAYRHFDTLTKIEDQDDSAWLYRAVSARGLGDWKEAAMSLYKFSRLKKEFWKNPTFKTELQTLSSILFTWTKQESERFSVYILKIISEFLKQRK